MAGVGRSNGLLVGFCVGVWEGSKVFKIVGNVSGLVGRNEKYFVGLSVGNVVGSRVCVWVGDLVGYVDGANVGIVAGDRVKRDGAASLGLNVGGLEGSVDDFVGAVVGPSTLNMVGSIVRPLEGVGVDIVGDDEVGSDMGFSLGVLGGDGGESIGRDPFWGLDTVERSPPFSPLLLVSGRIITNINVIATPTKTSTSTRYQR